MFTQDCQLNDTFLLTLSFIKLIENLYSTRPSQDVFQIQQDLQAIQKSANGHELADALLSGPAYSANVKYFGALTLTVQITANANSSESLWRLLKSNLRHLVDTCYKFVANPHASGSLMPTIRKLMSNSSLIFMNLNESQKDNSKDEDRHWKNPINTFIQVFSHRSSTSAEQWADSAQFDILVDNAVNASVSYDHLLHFIQSSVVLNNLLLMFTEIIVEDLSKYQLKKNNMTKVYEIVHEHLYISTMALINANLTMKNVEDDVLYSCITAWITYISMARNMSPHGRMNLSEMFHNLIELMCGSYGETDNFSSGEKVISIFANVFANDPTLMDFELREKVESIFVGVSRSGTADTTKHQWMLQYMNHLVTNEMIDELKELAVCVVDFLQINTLDLANKLFTDINFSSVNRENSQQYVKVLLQMTNFPLTPISQEFFSARMVDFWLDLADAYTNLVPTTITPQGSELATEIFQQVLGIYLPKISLLNKQKIMENDPDEGAVHEFDDFRTAVSDLIESLWSILGNDKLTNVLINNIGSPSESNVDIFETEAMSLLLNTLLTDMTLSESPWICDVLESCEFFVSNIILLLEAGYASGSRGTIEKAVGLDLARTSTTLIGSLAGYLKQSQARLNQCIDVLFRGLETCTFSSEPKGDEYSDKMETLTIRAISILCDTCRHELTSYLPELYNVLNVVLASESNVSNFTREKLARSLGFLIEARIDLGPEKQATYVSQAVDLFSSCIQQVMSVPQSQDQARENYIQCLLTCVSELGSALLPSDESSDSSAWPNVPEILDFWQRDPLQVRPRVLKLLLDVLNSPVLPRSSGFVEISCLILGKGLKLADDEPFFLKYSMSDIMTFILDQIPKGDLGASLPFYSYLLESLVNQHRDQLSAAEFDYIFDNVFLKHYQDVIAKDPDLQQTIVNFVNTILDCKPSLAIQSTYWESFILIEFIKLLSVREKFTIVAITKFWTKVLNNKKYTEMDQATAKHQINSIGQQIIFQTMFGLYHTQRSDLNSYTDLLRAFAAKFPMQTKEWLSNALPRICNNNLAHERFINKLQITRGNRAAANVILEWWLECNQLPSL